MSYTLHFTFRKSYWRRKEKVEKDRVKAEAAVREAALERRKKPHQRKGFKKGRAEALLENIENEMTLAGEHLLYTMNGTIPHPATVHRALNIAIMEAMPDKGLDACVMEICAPTETYYTERFGLKKQRPAAADVVRYPVVFSFIAAALLPPHNGYAVVINFFNKADVKYWAWVAVKDACPELSDEYVHYLLTFVLIVTPNSLTGLEGLADKGWLYDDIRGKVESDGSEARKVQTIVVINSDDVLGGLNFLRGDGAISEVTKKLYAMACRFGASHLIFTNPTRIIPEENLDMRIMIQSPVQNLGESISFTGWLHGLVDRHPTTTKWRFKGEITATGTVRNVEQTSQLPHDKIVLRQT